MCWEAMLFSRLEQFKRYPPAARLRREESTVRVRFTVDRIGRVLAAEIEKSSGSSLLDEEALALIHRAEPLPSPPPEVLGERIERTVPLRFMLQ
jgi:periplasmic protein TonB